METKTAKVYLHAVMTEGDNTPWYTISTTDMATVSNYTIVGEQEITFEIPELDDTLPAIIKNLEARRDEMRAAANAAITEVDNQIASLLAIENQS